MRSSVPSRLIVLMGVIASASAALLLLEVESQWKLFVLLAGIALILLLAHRRGLLPRFQQAAASQGPFALWLAVGATAMVAGVLYQSHFALLMLATVALYSIACLGLTLQFGYAGIANFAGAAFFGIGCYSEALLATHTNLPHLLILLAAGVFAALIGSVLILPILRTRGHYAALITIAFGILFKTFLEVNDALGGPQGLKVPGLSLFGWQFNEPLHLAQAIEGSFYLNYVALAVVLAAVAFVLVRRLERSWIGLNFDAVRLDEIAAAVSGIDIARWKILAFVLGNFLIGVAGAVYAAMSGFIAPNNFTFGDSLILVSIVILGGVGNALGVFVAAALMLVLPEKLQAVQEYRFLLYAVLVILILLYRPAGLLPRAARRYFPAA